LNAATGKDPAGFSFNDNVDTIIGPVQLQPPLKHLAVAGQGKIPEFFYRFQAADVFHATLAYNQPGFFT
jgi:hypothetical protein